MASTSEVGQFVGGHRSLSWVEREQHIIQKQRQIETALSEVVGLHEGGPPELLQIGIGHGWGQRRQVGVRASLGAAAFPSREAASVNLMVRLPVGKALDLGFAGAYLARAAETSGYSDG